MQISEGQSTRYPTNSVQVWRYAKKCGPYRVSNLLSLTHYYRLLKLCKVKRSHRVGDFLDRGNLRTFHSIRDAALSHVGTLGLLALV